MSTVGARPYPHPMRANDGTGQQGHVTPKHVLVDDSAPGILLDWRATDDGKWMAHVIWSDSDQLPARAHLEWLPEDRVSLRT